MTDKHGLESTPLAPEELEISAETERYKGYGRVVEMHFRHKRFDDGWSDILVREVYDAGDAVIVLPYDPKADRVVLIEQVRPGPLYNREPPRLIECIAGRFEEDEDAADVARRESLEEAGCVLGDIEPFLICYASPGVLSERYHFVVARTETDTIGGIHGCGAEHEDIRALTAPVACLPAALATGCIRNAPTIIAMQWLLLNRAALRSRWKV